MSVYGVQCSVASGRLPRFPTAVTRDALARDKEADDAMKKRLLEYVDRMLAGEVPVDNDGHVYTECQFGNLHTSECFNCHRVAIWVHTRLIYPEARAAAAPNADLPPEIVADYEEAQAIVMRSPRGAAALLRLVVQKLCAHLGEGGKNIDADIASLIGKGLNPLVQRALDIVRVVGNNAVHPGVMDMKDDRDTAMRLFGLINVIADQMITHPKNVNALYDGLPANTLAAIEARNIRATGGTTT